MAAPTDPEREAKARLDEHFTDLYRAHLRDVYSYAYYRVGNHHDAEDLTEQTFLQAYRHFERASAESDGRPLRPWLIRIAHNLAANLYRDRSRTPQTPNADQPPRPRPPPARRAPAAPLAHPDRAHPRCESLPGPVAQAADADRRHVAPAHAPH